MKKHTEGRLEDAIVYDLVNNGGYVQGDSDDFDTIRALEPARVIRFISQTQPKQWQALSVIHGENTGSVVLDSLCIKNMQVSLLVPNFFLLQPIHGTAYLLSEYIHFFLSL